MSESVVGFIVTLTDLPGRPRSSTHTDTKLRLCEEVHIAHSGITAKPA